MGLLVRPAGRTSWTDKLDRPVLFIWSLGQFAYSKIDLSVQFVHCCSFRVRQRPCFSIRKAKMVIVLEVSGRNSSISPQNYDQTSSFPSRTTTQLHSFPPLNYIQGIQHFHLNGYFLLTGGFNLKTRPSSDSEAATMYKLKGQSSNMRTGQGYK